MDPRLLDYYERELSHLRELGAEFSKEFPKIAGRLGVEGLDCADPYVERLLEGFAFLAARVQIKIDAEFPEFTNQLFDIVLPHYLSPTPSMAVFQLQPDLAEGTLTEGFVVSRGERIRSSLTELQTRCDFLTAHDVTLWPLEITGADYFTRDAVSISLPSLPNLRACVRIQLKATAGLTFDQLSLDTLQFFLPGGGSGPVRLYEHLLCNSIGMIVRDSQAETYLDSSAIQRVGFEADESLLPQCARSFSGYRLLQEYFAMPQRFLFLTLSSLSRAIQKCNGDSLEIIILCDSNEPSLENRVTAESFALSCTPAINLFPKRADRIHVSTKQREYHVVPDRSRPLDFEVYDVTHVAGYGSNPIDERPFHPFYHATNRFDEHKSFYTKQRRNRVLSSHANLHGNRTDYVGSEVFLSLVDADAAPFPYDLRQLGIETLCTNRDLPLLLGNARFTLESGAPVESVQCLVGPTPPLPSRCNLDGVKTWKLVSHLALNYLSLVDTDNGRGVDALKDLLAIYCDPNDQIAATQIEGLLSISSEPINRVISDGWPLVHARGLEVTILMDEMAFRGSGVFLLGSVLSEFLTRYVSINSFVETVLRTNSRGEINRWPATIGCRQTM